MLNSLHSIKARNLDSAKNIVFTICGIQAGSTYNVFPDEAILMGTIRSFDKPTLDHMMKRIHEISSKVAEAHECSAVYEETYSYPATVNHKEPT